MEKRSRRRIRDLVALAASQGLSQNEIGCARISMMARSTNAPCKGRIQRRKTTLHLFKSGLQRTAGPYKSAISRLMHRSNEGLLDHLVGVGERCGTLRPIEHSHGLMLINNSCGRRDNFRTSGGLQEVTSMLFRNTASSTATSSPGKTDARGRSASTGMQP